MPLTKSSSKKAFEHNFKAEEHAGKPKDQSLAIAYSVQRKSKRKKMADGGKVELDMPAADTEIISEKEPKNPNFDNPKPFEDEDSKIDRKPAKYADGGLIKDEDDLEASAQPSSPKEQPPAKYNEADADGHGDAVPESEENMRERHAMELAELHMATGGMIPALKENYEDEYGEYDTGLNADDQHPLEDVVERIMRKKFAQGGMVEDSNEEGPAAQRKFNIDAKSYDRDDSGEDFSYSDSGEDGDGEEKKAENEHDDPIVLSIRSKMKKRG